MIQLILVSLGLIHLALGFCAVSSSPGSPLIQSWESFEALLPSSLIEEPVVDTVLNPSYHYSEAAPDQPILFRERNGWCPYSERVWLAFEVKDIPYTQVLIDNMGMGRPDWYSGQTPQVKFPGNTQRQGDSLKLLRAIDEQYPTDGVRLFPEGREKKVESRICDFLACFPKYCHPSSRAAFLFASSGDLLSRKQFERVLEKTEKVLASNTESNFFVGDTLTAADIAWAPFLERYQSQLPCFYEGLNPYDNKRYPNLAAWYDNMDTLVPPYAARVSGDFASWKKVLNSQGYGNINAENLRDARRRSIHENMIQIAHSYYAEKRKFVATTPPEQAAAVIVRNRLKLSPDLAKVMGSRCTGGAQMADEALRCLVQALLSLNQQRRDNLDWGLGGVPDSDGYEEEIETDKEKQEDWERTTSLLKMAADYCEQRMCIPRDLGRSPAQAIRHIAKELAVLD